MSLDISEFCSVAGQILDELKSELGWMYSTTNGSVSGDIDFTVWSEIFSCPECAGEIVFHDHALDEVFGRVKESFPCPHCSASLSKKNLELAFESIVDHATNITKKRPKRRPVIIKFTHGRKKYEKDVDSFDLDVLKRINNMPHPMNAPCNEFPDMQMTRVGRMKTTNVTHIHDLFLPRTIQVLAKFFEKVNEVQSESIKKALKIIAQHQFVNASVMNRYRPASSFGNSPLTGVFYVSSLVAEANVFSLLRGT